MLTKAKFDKVVQETRLSSLSCNHGDPLRDLAEEIYWEGYCAGYKRAAELLQTIRPRVFGSNADAFLDANIDRIHRRVDAIAEYQGGGADDGRTLHP